MKHSVFKSGKLEERVEVPESWLDVPFFKYPDFLELIEKGEGRPDTKEVFKLFFSISEDMANSNFKIEMLHSMNSQLEFLKAEPFTKELATHFKFKGKSFRIPNEIGEMTLGKYRDIVESGAEVLSGRTSSLIETIKTYPEMIAVFVAPKGYTPTDLEDLAKEINVLPVPEIIGLGNFFIRQYVSLRSGTLKNSLLLSKITNKNKPDFQKSLKILVTY